MARKNVDTGFVAVTVQVPKSLHAFMDKFAELEGFHVEDWYVNWIHRDFEAFLDQLSGLDVDMKTLVEVNDLEETLQSQNPSFIRRIFHEDD